MVRKSCWKAGRFWHADVPRVWGRACEWGDLRRRGVAHVRIQVWWCGLSPPRMWSAVTTKAELNTSAAY